MYISRVLTVLSLLAALLSSFPSSAFDNELSRKTLKGLPGVNVLVEDLDQDAVRAGFDKGTFLTDLDSKLRLAGIKVLSEEESLNTPGAPYLYVKVVGMHKKPEEMAAYLIFLELNQAVLLARDVEVSAAAATWSVGAVGYGDIQETRRSLSDLADTFVNAWLSVNPKTGSGQ